MNSRISGPGGILEENEIQHHKIRQHSLFVNITQSIISITSRFIQDFLAVFPLR